MCTSSRGLVAPILSMGALYCFGLEYDTLVAFLHTLLHLYSNLGPEEMVAHQVKHSFEAYMADLIMATFQGSLPVHCCLYQLKECLLGPSLQNFSVQDALPQLEVVWFPEGAAGVQVSWLGCKGTGLRSCPTSLQSSDPGWGLPAGSVASL